jgi:hypothetical protein
MKRFIFYALDQYTIKVLCRKEWEAGVEHGIACEQQRIIKLLDEFSYPQLKPVYEIDETQWAIAKGQIHQYRRELAALIKGEN